jgi:hypothetical protein
MEAKHSTSLSVHAFALPLPSAPPLAEAEAAELTAMPLAPVPPPRAALPIALRHPPATEECELQNESYVSIVVFCVPEPPEGVPGPGAVGMSNVLEGRKDESEAGE